MACNTFINTHYKYNNNFDFIQPYPLNSNYKLYGLSFIIFLHYKDQNCNLIQKNYIINMVVVEVGVLAVQLYFDLLIYMVAFLFYCFFTFQSIHI